MRSSFRSSLLKPDFVHMHCDCLLCIWSASLGICVNLYSWRRTNNTISLEVDPTFITCARLAFNTNAMDECIHLTYIMINSGSFLFLFCVCIGFCCDGVDIKETDYTLYLVLATSITKCISSSQYTLQQQHASSSIFFITSRREVQDLLLHGIDMGYRLATRVANKNLPNWRHSRSLRSPKHIKVVSSMGSVYNGPWMVELGRYYNKGRLRQVAFMETLWVSGCSSG